MFVFKVLLLLLALLAISIDSAAVTHRCESSMNCPEDWECLKVGGVNKCVYVNGGYSAQHEEDGLIYDYPEQRKESRGLTCIEEFGVKVCW